MKIYIAAFLLCLLFSSCVALLNKDQTPVAIYTAEPSTIVYRNDTLTTITSDSSGYNSLRIKPPRKKDNLVFRVISDSQHISKEINIRSSISKWYYANVLSPYFAGFLIDFKNPRKYTYPEIISLDKDLNVANKIPADLKEYNRDINKRERDAAKFTLQRRKMLGTKPKDIFISINFPFFNHFSLSPDYENQKNRFGLIGMGLGVDYYYRKNRFINFTFAGAMTFTFSFPAYNPYHPDEDGREWDNSLSLYVLLTNNHRYDRFSMGYGLSLSRNRWVYNNNSYSNPYSKETNNTSLGLAFSGYYYYTNNFTIGLNYRPSFIRFDSDSGKKFRYEHLISLDFAIKIKLNKTK